MACIRGPALELSKGEEAQGIMCSMHVQRVCGRRKQEDGQN